MSLPEKVVDSLKQAIDTACEDPKSGIPGVGVVVVGKNGKTLFAHAGGKRGVGSAEPMTLDHIYWIASLTKNIVGIACMQLVEQGKLHLDDGDETERLVPELQNKKVLQKDGKLVEKNKKITLRMLLTHTAGFAYTFFNENLLNFAHPVGWDEFSGNMYDIINQPLVFQPGEGWEYGTGIDYAGIVVERATGLTLNDYFQKNIFGPLGLKDISLFPDAGMKKRLAFMNQRRPDGSLYARDHLHRGPLVAETPEQIKSIFNSGGAGAFATPSDYAQILATLLNDGTSPTTGAKILKKETVDLMFSNQIKDMPDFARQGIAAAKPDLTNPLPELYPVEGNPPQGWGLTFMLTNGGPTGRSEACMTWAGLANCWYWCDREKGVAGVVTSQILPFGDMNVLGLWFNVETQIYQALNDMPDLGGLKI